MRGVPYHVSTLGGRCTGLRFFLVRESYRLAWVRRVQEVCFGSLKEKRKGARDFPPAGLNENAFHSSRSQAGLSRSIFSDWQCLVVSGAFFLWRSVSLPQSPWCMVCLGPLLAKVCRRETTTSVQFQQESGKPHVWHGGITQEVICSLPENIFEISLLIQRGCGI